MSIASGSAASTADGKKAEICDRHISHNPSERWHAAAARLLISKCRSWQATVVVSWHAPPSSVQNNHASAATAVLHVDITTVCLQVVACDKPVCLLLRVSPEYLTCTAVGLFAYTGLAATSGASPRSLRRSYGTKSMV